MYFNDFNITALFTLGKYISNNVHYAIAVMHISDPAFIVLIAELECKLNKVGPVLSRQSV
jgi:hypothetical protein